MKVIVAAILFLMFFSCTVNEESDNLTEINDNPEETDDSFEKMDDTIELSDNTVDNETSDHEESDIDNNEVLPVVEFTSPDNKYKTDPVAIIVTTNEFFDVFYEYAAFHTVTGIHTEVLTIEEICIIKTCNDEDPKNDTAKAIKDFIMQISGLKYLVIGGDIEIVPSRKVYDKYSHILAGSFEGEFYTDFYFSDFSNWDSNNNGIYAEKNDQTSYMPDIAVGRIPVSTVEEAQRYFQKVVKHMTNYETLHVKNTLLLANVATEMSGIKINAGYYFETEGRTRDIIPNDFNVRKIYTDTFPFPASDAEKLNNTVQKQAMESGMNLIIHNGHGYPTILSCEQSTNENNFTSKMAYDLNNTTYPIFLSCACQAGQFEAPFEYTYVNSAGDTVTRKFTEDAAGEFLVNAPDGGAVAYLGNTTTGLGLAGGSQLIDEMMRNMFFSPKSVLGDSLVFGLAMLKKDDTFKPPIMGVPAVKVVDEASWKWTKKSVVLLGSPLITFWRDIFYPLKETIGITTFKVQGGTGVELDVPQVFEWQKLTVLTSSGKIYSLDNVQTGSNVFYFEGDIESLYIGADVPGYQHFYQKWEK